MKSPWVRRNAIAFGALVGLLVVVAAVLIATFDANRYKTLVIDWMRNEHQRTLAIDGPIGLSFFPRLAVKVKLRLSKRGRDDEFAVIDEAAFAVKLLPLLRKQLVIDRVSGRGIHATYLRGARGVRNIDDLFSGDVPPIVATGGGAVHVTRPSLARQRGLACQAASMQPSISRGP